MSRSIFEPAGETVERFVNRFGDTVSLARGYRQLAYHAALPLVLTPELVHYLRHHFLPYLPPIAEADLLLSELCRPVGYELFAMDGALRGWLLNELRQQAEGPKRMRQVARLLIQHVNDLARGDSRVTTRELHTQKWGAMVYLDDHRSRAVEEIKQALTEAVGDQAQLEHLRQIAEAMAPQLENAAPELVEYARMVAGVLDTTTDFETTVPTAVMVKDPSETLGIHVAAPVPPSSIELHFEPPWDVVNEPDVYISYALIDNKPLMEGELRWISRFRYSLEVLLGQILGVKPLIGGEPLTSIGLANAAVLVPVLSPAFVHSGRCIRELTEFLRDRVVEDVFKVVKRPVPDEDHPVELRGLEDYEFYRYDRETGRVRTMDPESPEDRRLFLSKVDDLAQDVAARIQRLKSASSDKELVTLYVAQCTPDVQVERDRLLRSLRQQNIAVLPRGPLPIHKPDLRERLRRDLDRCRLSVHIVGSSYGPLAEGQSLAEIQNEVAMERGAKDSKFCRLIWIVPGPAPDDERQVRFIERVWTDPDAQRGAEILHRSFEDFETVLSDKLALSRWSEGHGPGGSGDE